MRIFTDEQYKELKVYGKQIEEYIRKEIIPYVKYTECLEIGTEKTKLGNAQYTLIIDKHHFVGYSGHLGICFKEEERSREIGRDVYVYDSWNYGAEYLYQLCSNWKNGTNIKQRLISMIEKSKTENLLLFFQATPMLTLWRGLKKTTLTNVLFKKAITEKLFQTPF